MSKFEFTCWYCGNFWRGDYKPQEAICSQCNDKNIKVVSTVHDKVNYYEGCPKFINEYFDNWNK